MSKLFLSTLRPRAIGVVCAAVAVVSGAAYLAGPATAAAPPVAPSITLTAPTVVGNDGTGGGSGSVSVVNGTAAVPFARVDLSFTPPTGLKAANLMLTGLPTGDTATITDTDATITAEITPAAPLAAGASETIPFTLTVTSGATPITGALSSTASLHSVAQASDTATGTVLATSNTTTTQIVTGPSAPKFNVPGPATIYQNYAATVLSPGTPPATVRVYDNKPNSGSTGTSAVAVAPTTGTNGDTLFTLNDGLVFDATTGTLTGRAVDLGTTDATPDSFTIIANNGVGGASTAAPATAGTPATAVHDVSLTITVPVLFVDVPLSNQFATAIYSLAADGTIKGYGDGTFRANNTVTRDAFVQFAAGVLNKGGFTTPTGACDTTHPSAFADVPASSPFCQEIAALSGEGIVNGFGDATFRPGTPVARDQAAAFLYRVDEKFRGVDPKTGGDAQCTTPSPFTDVTATNVFCGDVEWAAKNGITKGYTDGGFHPAAGAARYASAQFVYKLEVLEDLV